MNDHEEMWFGIREEVRIMREEESAGSTFTDLAGGVDNFNKILNQYMEFIRKFDFEVSRDVYVFCLSEYDWESSQTASFRCGAVMVQTVTGSRLYSTQAFSTCRTV